MASVKSITRKRAVREIGQLYKRAKGFDLAKCAYCGDLRQALDHVPPISYAYSSIDIPKFLKNGGAFLLFPVCDCCNQLLGAKTLISYAERVQWLYKKYAELIIETSWSEEELEEIGRGLKTMILAYEKQRKEYIKKLHEIESKMIAVCV